MSSTETAHTIILDTGRSITVWAVAFQPDEKHLLGGNNYEIQRWRLEDGQEVGKQMGMDLRAISVSRDDGRIVCGTIGGASVWDTELRKKAVEADHSKDVLVVDVSPDSTKFATGINIGGNVNIWDMKTGKRLVGPIRHEGFVNGIKFSPDSNCIATSLSGGPIHVFDSLTGNELITIDTRSNQYGVAAPLAWSNDGQRIFVALSDGVESFNVLTGTQLTKSPTLHMLISIALAPSGQFLAAVGWERGYITLLDATTLIIISAFETSGEITSIAISPNYLATGQTDGKIAVRDLGRILPASYGPFHTPTHDKGQQDERPVSPGANPKQHADLSPVESQTHGNVENNDLLEVEVTSDAPALEFDYDESPSPLSSSHNHEDEAPPLDIPHVVSTTYPPTAPPEETVDTPKSSIGILILKRLPWTRIKKSNKDPTLNKPVRVPKRMHLPVDRRTSSQFPATVDATDHGPSRMAAAQPNPRTVSRYVGKPKPKPTVKATRPRHRDAARRGQPSRDPMEAGSAQRANDSSSASVEGIHVTGESGKAVLRLRFSMAFPPWMCCGIGSEVGTH